MSCLIRPSFSFFYFNNPQECCLFALLFCNSNLHKFSHLCLSLPGVCLSVSVPVFHILFPLAPIVLFTSTVHVCVPVLCALTSLGVLTQMLIKSLIVAALVAAPVSGVCNKDWCTSANGEGGFDCVAGNLGEKCTCSKGSARLASDDDFYVQVNNGDGKDLLFYEYTCCDDDDKPNMGDNCGIVSCDQKYCTSPDEEGTDCWAGRLSESCTCSEGRVAALTGDTDDNEIGSTFYEYTCCPANLDSRVLVGEMCGDFEDPPPCSYDCGDYNVETCSGIYFLSTPLPPSCFKH
jgi:hypothetical protein